MECLFIFMGALHMDQALSSISIIWQQRFLIMSSKESVFQTGIRDHLQKCLPVAFDCFSKKKYLKELIKDPRTIFYSS